MSCGIFIERARMHVSKVLGCFLSKTLEVFMDILVFGEQNDADSMNDKDLASLFVKTHFLPINRNKPLKPFFLLFFFKMR